MQPGEMPMWMRFRPHREIPENREPSKIPSIVLMLLLGVLTALCVYAALELPSAFHILVMAAGVTLLVSVLLSRVQCSRKTAGAFLLAAVAVNFVMAYTLTVIEDPASGAIAYIEGVIFTGLIGLLLLTRTRTALSTRAKAVIIGAVIAMSSPGPLLYLFVPTEGTLGTAAEWLILTSIPMMVVLMATAIVLSAHHRSDVTVPSDKWV
ncbi:MAG: hypothetical protein MUE55_00040 [Thermoplasmata archaeon]|nr:hypothetical protein [Thermoplasmata archaeon]